MQPLLRRSSSAQRELIFAMAVAVLAWTVLVAVQIPHQGNTFVQMWMLMVVAMMVPTVLRPMRRVSAGSFPRAVGFLLGYVVIWFIAVVPAYAIMRVPWTPWLLALAWVAVGLYQSLPWTQRALRSCRSLRTEDSAWASGVRQGAACLIACGPLMFIGMATLMAPMPHAFMLLGMAALTGFMMWEKSPRVSAAAIQASGVVLILCATVALLTVSGSGHVHI
jgi:hypothetical protein